MAAKSHVESQSLVATLDELFPSLQSLETLVETLADENRKAAELSAQLQTMTARREALRAEHVEFTRSRMAQLEGRDDRQEHIGLSLEQQRTTFARLTDNLGGDATQLAVLRGALWYMACLRALDESRTCIRHADDAAAHLAELVRMQRELEGSMSVCANLQTLLQTHIAHWRGYIGEARKRALLDALEPLGWNAGVPMLDAPEPALRALETALMACTAFESGADAAVISEGGGAPLLPLAVATLLESHLKRFWYHFLCDERPTARADKPEWAHAHLLSILRKSAQFLVERIQPLQPAGTEPVIHAFIKGLVLMARTKLKRSMPELIEDDSLFAHAVDEAVAFDAELRRGYGYSASERGGSAIQAVCVLEEFYSSEAVLRQWLELELRLATAQLDHILAEPTAHRRLSGLAAATAMPAPTELQPTHAAEALVTLLESVLERAGAVPVLAVRLSFWTQVIASLLDRFVRLITAATSGASSLSGLPQSSVLERHAAVANALVYVSKVVREWTETLPFALLRFVQVHGRPPVLDESRTDSDDGALLVSLSGSIADRNLHDLESGARAIVDALANNLCDTFREYSFAYCQERHWTESESELSTLAAVGPIQWRLSRCLTALVDIVGRQLGVLERVLESGLMLDTVDQLAREAVGVLYRSVVSKRRFTQWTGQQLCADVRVLEGVLSRGAAGIGRRVDKIFERLRSAAAVLALSPAQLAELRGQTEALVALGDAIPAATVAAKRALFLASFGLDSGMQLDEITRLIAARR